MRIIILSILVGLSLNTMSQTSTVKGVVTYFFNKYQGDKPDLGAKAYLIDPKQATLNTKSIDSFINGKIYIRLYNEYVDMALTYETMLKKYEGKKRYREEYEEAKKNYDDRVKYRDEFFSKMKYYGVETTEKFTALDRRVFEMLLKINNNSTSMTTIDATGSYSFTTKPGDYYIYIVSKNRTGINLTEISGKIYFKEITLNDGEIKDVSNNFDLY